MIEELDQVEEQQQQDPPNKRKVLYDAVSKKYDIGTFEEFEKKLQDPKKREAFYNGVGSEYDLGTYREFESKVKKKDGGQTSPTATSPTQSPSNPPLESQKSWGSNPLNPASVNFTKKPFPSTTGGMFNDIKEAVIKGKQEYERTGKPLPSFAKEKPKAKDISVKSQASMGLIDPDMKMMPLTFESAKLADNDENRSGYIWNQFLRSAGQIAAGATDLGGLLGTAIIPDEDQIAPDGRKFTDDELTKIWREKQVKTVRETPEKLLGSKVTPEQMEKYGKEFVTSVVGGLAGSALPMLTTGGIGLGLQAYDAGLESINNSEEGKNLPEWQKTAFGTGVGVAGLFLEKYGMDNIFGKQSSKVALNLMLKTVSGLMKKSDAPITTAALEAALDAGARNLKSRVLKSTGKVASSVAVEGVTGGLQEGANILAEKIVNSANDKLVFEPQSFGEVTGRILNAAKLEAGGGAILGGISLPFSKTRNYIAEKVASAKSEEDINNLRREVVAQAEKGNVSEKELNEVNSLIDKYVGVNSKIPDTVPDRKYAADKIIEREELELQIEKKVAEKESVDVAFQPEIEAEIEFLSNRVEEINNELVNPPVGELVAEEAVAAELPDTYIINGKPVSQQEFDTAIDNAKNTKEALDVEYNGDDEVRIQKIIDLGGTYQAGTTTITDEAPTTTTEVTKPVQQDAGVPEQQGTKEAVSKSTEPIGQGNAETTTTFLEKGNSVGVGKDVEVKVGDKVVDADGVEYEVLELSTSRKGVPQAVVKSPNRTEEQLQETARANVFGRNENRLLYKSPNDPKFLKEQSIPIAQELSDQRAINNSATSSTTIDLVDLKIKAVEQSLKETPKAGSVGEVKAELPAQEKVKQLRLQEQAEYDAMPNPKDEAERKRIYDKYDKLISPLLDEGEVKAEAPKPKEGKYETKAKAIAEKIMAAKVVPDWLKIDDENISTKGSSAEDLKKVLADAVINMGKLLDKGVEFSQAVKESVKAMIDIHGEGKRKEIEEGFAKYYRENEADVPPPSEPPVDKTKESDGKDDLSEKGILNRLNKAAGVPEQAKKGFEEAGLKYKVASREEAQSVAKSVIDEFGIDQAVLFAEANKFKGGVSSAIYAESLNRLYEQEQNAKTPKEKADIAAKFAEISLQYDETSREKGRDISYIDFFYKKSPLGIEIAENARRKKDFDKWSKNKEQSWKEVFEDMRKDPEFEEVFNEEVRERMKKERAESRKSRIEKVDKFFDDAIDKFSKGGATYSTVIPPQVITAALKGLKKAYHAGENIVEAVQQAIDYISTELKGADWDKEKFRKEWESKLADAPSKNKLTDEESAKKRIEKFINKLKGLTKNQRDELIRNTANKIILDGALDYPELRDMIAEVTGRGKMTPEQSAKLKELVKDANAVDEAGKKARETRTSQSLKDYREAEKKAGKASRELSILLNSKPEILKRLTSIMQLNTLGIAALVNNPIYNLVNQVGVRLPVGVVKSGIDLGINKIGKLFGKDYKRETDVFSVGVQREFFKKLGLGGREAVGQFLTGLNRMDYIQKEVNSQQIRPITAILELKEYAQGKRNLTKAQIIDKALEATVGVPAEIVARTLNLGDKPMRFAADAGQSAAFAKALGLKGIDYDMFMEFPREEAYRRYKEQGLSDAEAGKKADYIKETIIKEGERSTFQQDNVLNDVLGKVFGGEKSGVGALTKAVVVSPYIKIPSNAYWSYFNIINPEVAFLQGLLYAGKAAAKQKGVYKRGLFDKENTSAAKDLNEAKYWIAHGVVGMATKAVIGSLVAAGIFRSSNDEDDTKKEREGEQYYEPQGTINMDKLWAYMKGEDPSKIKGGYTISNRWFGHWGSVGNSIAKREEDMTPEQRENQKEVLTEMFDRMSASFLPELEQGIFGNSSSLVKAMASNDWKQWGVNTMNMFTNIVHPATAAQLSKAQLPYYAKVKSDNFMTELKNSMLNRSSTLRKLTNEYPPSKVGIWGDVLTKKDDVLMRMFGISKTNDDNFAQPIYEDYKRTNNTKFFPSAVKPEVSSNGERVKLPADKALELEKYIGEQRRKLVAPYVNNMAFFEDDKGKRTYYKDLKTDEEKIKKLDIIYDEGFKRGKEIFLQKPENKIYEIKEKSYNEKEKDKGEERSNKSLRKDLSKIK